MALKHTVRDGDCIESIALKHGLFWETLWNHADNAYLKNARNDHNVILPGDVINIPDLEKGKESVATEHKHRFRRKGVPCLLELQLMDDDKPRKNLPFKLIIDGVLIEGSTDGEGKISEKISPLAKKGKLTVGDEDETYELNLGYIDPLEEISGVQGRLNNLGIHCGNVDGKLGDRTKQAIAQFQRDYELEETGKADAATRDKLKELYGC